MWTLPNTRGICCPPYSNVNLLLKRKSIQTTNIYSASFQKVWLSHGCQGDTEKYLTRGNLYHLRHTCITPDVVEGNTGVSRVILVSQGPVTVMLSGDRRKREGMTQEFRPFFFNVLPKRNAGRLITKTNCRGCKRLLSY